MTHRRGEDGTHADLTLMPPAAYSPESEVLAATLNQITQAMTGGAAVSTPSTDAQVLAAAQAPGTTVNLTPPR